MIYVCCLISPDRHTTNGYPVEKAAKVAVETVAQFLEQYTDAFDMVEWVLFDDRTLKAYEDALEKFY